MAVKLQNPKHWMSWVLFFVGVLSGGSIPTVVCGCLYLGSNIWLFSLPSSGSPPRLRGSVDAMMLTVCAQAPGALIFLPVVQTQSPASPGLSFMPAFFQLPSDVLRACRSPGSQVFLKTDFRSSTHSFLPRLSLVNFWLVCCLSQQTALSLQNSGFPPLSLINPHPWFTGTADLIWGGWGQPQVRRRPQPLLFLPEATAVF